MIETVFRTLFFYFIIVIAYRIMGKREVGQLGIIDLIISILIAELVALGIEKIDQSIWMTLLPMIVLVLLEVILGYLSVKSRKINKLFGGKPTIIISNGKIVYKNLINQRYSLDDLLLELRKKSISSLEDVEYALLETNGELSIFPYNTFKIKENIPLPFIIEGIIQEDILKQINKSKIWVNSLLDSNNLDLNNVFYAIYQKNHVYVIKRTN
ncbi:MAG: DUF421 domain-containing protein [Firmicutes bacterium]|nr:DUF421 domain-containing protein [Bacillota bacterium]